MSMTEIKSDYVLNKIKRYAKAQLLSKDTFATIVVALVMLYTTYLVNTREIVVGYVIALYVIMGAALCFGLYVTIPALIMYLAPYQSRVFPKGTSTEERKRMCAEFDRAWLERRSRDFIDMTASEETALFEGVENLELIRWSDMVRVTKTEYAAKKMYKGMFYLNFFDSRGKKHVLDIHNGVNYNPLKQMQQIFIYIQNNHPQIKIEISNNDYERIMNREAILEKVKEFDAQQAAEEEALKRRIGLKKTRL